jgi:hypothetical protein
MPRILLTIVLPLLLPTALYLLWVTVLQPARHDGATQWAALPWLWLAGAGVVLSARRRRVSMFRPAGRTITSSPDTSNRNPPDDHGPHP